MNACDYLPLPSPDNPLVVVRVPEDRRDAMAKALTVIDGKLPRGEFSSKTGASCLPVVFVDNYSGNALWTDGWFRRHGEMVFAATGQLNTVVGYCTDDGRSRAGYVDVCLKNRVVKWIEPILNGVTDSTVRDKVNDWIRVAIADVVAGPNKGGFGLAILSAFARGWLPVQWRGTWPKGFMVVWCPPGSPQCQVPPECVPTEEQLLQGGGWGSVKPPRRAKPPPLAASPEIAVVPPATWKDLLATDHRDQALAQHFAPLAETPDCRDLLKRLIQRVERIEVAASSLTLQLHRDAGMSGRGVADVIPLVCGKPYTGSLKGLPPSLAYIMRRHNGMTLNAGASVLAEWLPYQKGKFVVEWDAWHTPDPSDANDPFPTQPLVPVTDGSDLWLLHPTQRLANGEAPVVVLEHEMGTLGEPLPYPAGGAFLRLVLHALTGKSA